VRRYRNGTAGKISAVSESGFPVFGALTQDPKGRIHSAWEGEDGLSYRRSATSGANFGAPRTLSKKSKYFNLALSANPKGQATVVYDSNGFSGVVGGFTAG
jgi:hypothetical protein